MDAPAEEAESVPEAVVAIDQVNPVPEGNMEVTPPVQPTNVASPANTSLPQPVPRPRELKVEDALLYLDQVKMEFYDKPHIYNEFLDIMKNFKAQSINTPGVIERVKNLFRGYNKLILGFNTFLPEGEGYKIELTAEEEAFGRNGPPPPQDPSAQPTQSGGMPAPQTQFRGEPPHKLPPHLAYAGNPFPSQSVQQQQSQQQSQQPQQLQQQPPQQQQQLAPAPALSVPQVDADGIPTGFSRPPQQMQQQHAISYVTTIRNRFAKEPDTYRAFLKILHTYQKEQKGIKEVLEQVSELFADHPDLLMEFTYFLPDAVQDQAKERLHRAAKESVVRRKLAAKLQATTLKQQQQQQQGHGAPSPSTLPAGQPTAGVKRSRAEKESKSAAAAAASGVAALPADMKFGAKALASTQAAASTQKKAARRRVEGASAPQPPVSTVTFFHTSSERRFFDQVKELLCANTREPWSEFVRCLELFNQQLIDRSNMLSLVQELFASSGSAAAAELFEEFRILLEGRAGFETKGHEIWYAIPLSEIDFSQCRKCTPSYRALPKDFPPTQCSDMAPEDAAVLNPQWVSIPIGSEESHSFKHMRKNQYEEALFKCEDERFEIDMIIDSNMCTIKLLEPVTEEIASLRNLEMASTASGDKNGAALKLSLQLEKRSMGTIHLNSISRIYGEHGAEILELLRKNPAGTIPVVLRRLKQKDYEWRRARQELDKQWRELLDKNFEKSFDHRSFYFRQTDRRAYSPRHLVGDIKTRALGPLVAQTPAAAEAEELLLRAVGATYALHPSLAALPCMQSAPAFHLALAFDTVDPALGDPSHHHHVIHKDVYRVLCYAAEVGGLSSSDKERVAALWRDFLKVFFNMPVHYLHSNTAITAATATAAEEDEVDQHLQSWSDGTKVLTVYGQGEVVGFRGADGMYRVRLSYGVAFMADSAIIGAEQLSVQALNAIGVAVDPETGAERILNVNVSAASPNAAALVSDPCKVFFGTQMCYVFLRLYHTIFTRLLLAKQLAAEAASAQPKEPNKNIVYAKESKNNIKSRPLYNSFLGQLLASIDGSLDSNRYEDSLRLLLGNKSYVLLTLDKVVQQALKCLQVMANDDSVNKLVGLFIYHRSRNPKGVDASLYQSHVAQVLSNTLEEVYRLQLVTGHQTTTQVGCQFLGILTAAQTDTSSSAEKAPQRVLIDEMPEDDDNVHNNGAVPMEGTEEDENDDPEADPAGLLSSMMSMGDNEVN